MGLNLMLVYSHFILFTTNLHGVCHKTSDVLGCIHIGIEEQVELKVTSSPSSY